MASLEDYKAYHNYILGVSSAMTMNAWTMLRSGATIVDDEGVPIEKLTLQHITGTTDQELKDGLLLDALRMLERFELKSTELDQVTEYDPIREVEPGETPASTPEETETPTA